MSTSDTTDILMRELIALDPTFTEKEAEVRALITLLAEKKPHVTIDEVFVRDLRARLIQPRRFPLRSPYHRVNWWAVHLAPIGVIALLLLILMPNGLRYFEEQSVSTQEINLEERDASFRSAAPSAKIAPESGSEASDTNDLFSTMGQGGGTPPLPSDYFSLQMQQPGVSIIIESVTLTQPGFVVIHTFDDPRGIGPVVGISPLQNNGTTVGVPVYLRNVTHRGETYYAALYHDNGNGVFSLSDDIPVIDPTTGTPFGVLFTIGVSETW